MVCGMRWGRFICFSVVAVGILSFVDPSADRLPQCISTAFAVPSHSQQWSHIARMCQSVCSHLSGAQLFLLVQKVIKVGQVLRSNIGDCLPTVEGDASRACLPCDGRRLHIHQRSAITLGETTLFVSSRNVIQCHEFDGTRCC